MLMSYAFPTSGIHLEINGKGNVAPAPVSVPAWLLVGAAVAPVASTVATTRATSASAAARDFFMALHPLLLDVVCTRRRARPGSEPGGRRSTLDREARPAARCRWVNE